MKVNIVTFYQNSIDIGSSRPEVFCKKAFKGVLRNFVKSTEKHLR